MSNTWNKIKQAGKDVVGGGIEGLKGEKIPLRERTRRIGAGIRKNALTAALVTGGAAVGGLVGTDIALAKAKTKAKEVGEQTKAKVVEKAGKVKEKATETKDKVSDSWKRTAEKMKKNNKQ